jgi:hypothetical protein
MNKALAISLIFAAFIIGAIGGAWCITYCWHYLSIGLITRSSAAEASADVKILEQLRADNVTNSIAALETRLDGSIGELGLYMNKISKADRDPQALKALQMAKEYREKYPHPHTDYPEIDQMVSNAFSLVSDQGDN